MSYARFSSDDWQCDVYVWADVDGSWRTLVAGRRFVFNQLPDLGPPPLESDEAFRAWWDRGQRVMDMRGDEAHGHWLELPEPDGGCDYRHDTPGECADNLERLRSAGFNVPQYAIAALRREKVSQS